jgi:hypothetical protein
MAESVIICQRDYIIIVFMTSKFVYLVGDITPKIHVKIHTLNLISDRPSLKYSFSNTSSTRFCHLSLTNTSNGIRHINLPFAKLVVSTSACFWVYLKICAQLSRPLRLCSLPCSVWALATYIQYCQKLPHSVFVICHGAPPVSSEGGILSREIMKGSNGRSCQLTHQI